MTDAQFNELVSTAIDAALTEAQAAALNAELARSPVRREDYLRQIWTSLLLETGFPSAHLRPVRRPVSRKWFAAAACLLLFLGVAFAAMAVIEGTQNSEDGISAPAVTAEGRISGSFPSATATTVRTADVGLSGAGLTIVYVATNGNDSAAGTVDAPFLTISNAIAQLGANGGKAYVAAGKYQIDSPVVVTNTIAIIGMTGRPEDVVLDGQAKCRVLILSNANARVQSVVVENGKVFNNSQSGADIWIQAGGGIVSNCIVRNGYAGGYGAKGGGIYTQSAVALVTGCVITNCTTSDENSWGGNKGAGVHLDIGRLENCLVANCRCTSAFTSSTDISAGGVMIWAGSVVNCTVLTNIGSRVGGIWASPSVGIKNCVMVDNVAAHWAMTNELYNAFGTLASSNAFVNCATDTTVPLNDTCVTGTAATFFRDYAHGDFTPNESADRGGSLYDAGADVGWTGANTDLAGKSRVVGKRIDIGCYECQKGSVGGFVIRVL